MTLIDDIKRDREAGTPGDWQCLEEGINSWSITPECNSLRFVAEELCNAHDARRIARVPQMEAALLAAEELAKAVEARIHAPVGREVFYSENMHAALDAFRKALEAGE